MTRDAQEEAWDHEYRGPNPDEDRAYDLARADLSDSEAKPTLSDLLGPSVSLAALREAEGYLLCRNNTGLASRYARAFMDRILQDLEELK